MLKRGMDVPRKDMGGDESEPGLFPCSR